MLNAVFIGGGPAGLAPLVWAARKGTLPLLAANGLLVVEQAKQLGAGRIGRYAIGSDTLAETFIECLEDSADPRLTALRRHPDTVTVAAHKGGSVPLPLVVPFLAALGEALSASIRSAGGQVLTSCEAVSSLQQSDGSWRTRLRGAAAEHEVVSRHLVIATGGSEHREALHSSAVAGEPLLPRFADKVMLSGEVLAEGGAAAITSRLAATGNPKIAIVGGSHSALAAANVVLNRCQMALEPGAVTVLHLRPLRVFYPSAAAALADGYTDFGPDDICPVSHRVFRLAGFRLESRDLLMRALGLGGRPAEPRFRLHRLDGAAAEAEGRALLEQADLIIAALGYRPNALPLLDTEGQVLALPKAPAPLVDRHSRVLDAAGRPIPGLFGLGLAAGFIPSGPLGGEPSFRGQTNGIWLWQNGVGAMIVDSLLREQVDHVANSAAAE